MIGTNRHLNFAKYQLQSCPSSRAMAIHNFTNGNWWKNRGYYFFVYAQYFNILNESLHQIMHQLGTASVQNLKGVALQTGTQELKLITFIIALYTRNIPPTMVLKRRAVFERSVCEEAARAIGLRSTINSGESSLACIGSHADVAFFGSVSGKRLYSAELPSNFHHGNRGATGIGIILGADVPRVFCHYLPAAILWTPTLVAANAEIWIEKWAQI